MSDATLSNDQLVRLCREYEACPAIQREILREHARRKTHAPEFDDRKLWEGFERICAEFDRLMGRARHG